MKGENWAKYDRAQFPIKRFDELKLRKEDFENHSDEILKSDIVDNEWVNKQLSTLYCVNYSVIEKGVLDKIGQRYSFSRYVVDPNKFRFRKVVRIIALIMLFIKNMKIKVNKNNTENLPKNNGRLI